MIITQHAHIYSFHTSKFNFGEIFFLIFLSIQPLVVVDKVGTRPTSYSSGGALVASRRPPLQRLAVVGCCILC